MTGLVIILLSFTLGYAVGYWSAMIRLQKEWDNLMRQYKNFSDALQKFRDALKK
jgi:hypothetical protein